MPENVPFSPSRRNLMRMAATAGVVAGVGSLVATTTKADAVENSTLLPSDFSYPAVTGPTLAIWGSSSFEGARATEGVSTGYDARLEVVLPQFLGVSVLGFGRGGETSTDIAARRGVSKYITQLVFPDDMIPASGSVVVTLEEGSPIVWNEAQYFPGMVQDIFCYIEAIEGQEGSYLFTRIGEGEARYAPQGTTANYFQSYQELISRSSYHLLQVGRNNLDDFEQIKADTEACFKMAPGRSIVLGHFRSKGDAKDSDRAKQVEKYNTWAASTYGNLFMNPEEYLREVTKETWLRYGDLSGSNVWDSKEDEEDYKNNRIPRSLYASDGLHLNGWGYLALARQIQAKVTEMGWFA